MAAVRSRISGSRSASTPIDRAVDELAFRHAWRRS